MSDKLYDTDKFLNAVKANRTKSKESEMAKFGGRFEPDAKDKEIARLRAELEALRPKPVVHSCVYGVEMGKYSKHWPEFTAGAGKQNLELTFHDGKLVSAEVINQGGVK